MEFPKTYVINLDKDVERLSKMKQQLGNYDIKFTRIPAVYGKDLSKAEIKDVTNGFCNTFCTYSSIGCAMSHLKTYETILKNSDPYALILEDDVVFEPDFKKQVEQKLARVPKDFDIVYLGCALCKDNSRSDSTLVDFFFNMVCDNTMFENINESVFTPKFATALHAYVISNKGAEKLLKLLKRNISGHIDGQIMMNKSKFNMYVIRPLLAYQDLKTNESNQSTEYPTIISRLLPGNDEYRIPYSYLFTIPLYIVGSFPLNSYNMVFMILCLISGIVRNKFIVYFVLGLGLYEWLVEPKNRDKVIQSTGVFLAFYLLGLSFSSIC